MSVNTDSMIRNILDRVSRIGYVKPEDIPYFYGSTACSFQTL